MNVYEAYLAVKEGKIIKATVGGGVLYVFSTHETYRNKVRIYKIDPDYYRDYKEIYKIIDDIFTTDAPDPITDICLDSFDETSAYETVSIENMLDDLNDKSHNAD